MQYGELRSYRGSRLVNEFSLPFSSFIFDDTFKTREPLFYIFLKLVFHLLQQHQVIVGLEKERIRVKVNPLQCLCQVPMLMIERGNPLLP